MSFAQFVTFDFVEGNYTLKFTQQSQSKNQNKVDLKKESRLTYRNEMNALAFNIFFTICYFVCSLKNGGIKTIKNKINAD